MRMQGNTILVAGGTRGLGRGIAELLCRLGNEVLVFDAEPAVAEAQARATPGLRAVEIDLADPWSVAGFAEQVARTCPDLNMIVNVTIAFPVKHLPGLQALQADDSSQALEAHRLGIRHLTGVLLPHLRKRAHGSVLHVSAGPAQVPAAVRRAALEERHVIDGSLPACSTSVRTRWVCARIDVVDVTRPSHAAPASPGRGMPRAEFVSSVAHVLAEGLHDAATLARLRAIAPPARPAARTTRGGDRLPTAVC